jgi:ABC-type Co2+ transport system permease subunit
MKGFRTLAFNFSLLVIGLIDKLDVPVPAKVIEAAHEVLMAFGIHSVDGSTLIGIGVAGIFLRVGTTTPAMVKR